MGLLLYLVALIIRPLLLGTGLLYGIYKSFLNSRLKNGFKYADAKLLSMAVAIDKYGNVVMSELLNDSLLNDGAEVRFGEIHLTISSFLGINQRDGHLNKAGHCVAAILDFLEKEHCKNSIPTAMR